RGARRADAGRREPCRRSYVIMLPFPPAPRPAATGQLKVEHGNFDELLHRGRMGTRRADGSGARELSAADPDHRRVLLPADSAAAEAAEGASADGRGPRP